MLNEHCDECDELNDSDNSCIIKNNIFSNKDCNYVIGILVGIILLILSKRLWNNTDVLQVFSFMANGISIILAIVAIIYSFIQSQQSSQQYMNTVQTLAQIEIKTNNLIELINNNIDKSEDTIKILNSIDNASTQDEMKAMIKDELEKQKKLERVKQRQLIEYTKNLRNTPRAHERLHNRILVAKPQSPLIK